MSGNGTTPLLRREDFSEEWIAKFAAQAELLGSPLLSPEEREASLKPFITEIAPGQDAWVFGYGSLMWNPAVHVAETRPGTILRSSPILLPRYAAVEGIAGSPRLDACS